MRASDAGSATGRRAELSVVPAPVTERRAAPQTGRRWDDRPGELPAMTFARFLTTKPALDDVARFLVALLCWPVGAQGILIARDTPDGPVLLARYLEQVSDWPESELVDHVPDEVADLLAATRGVHPVFRTEPADPRHRPMAAWPLGSPAGPVGELVLLLASPLEPGVVSTRVGRIAEILAVYLAGAGATAPRSATVAHGPTEVRLAAGALTARQRQVLHLMSQGMTNPQIAIRIGFSDSTVRMESMAIYRALGVHDRHHAIVAGRALGLLDPE